MFNPPHPGELLREIIAGLREESGQAFTYEEVADLIGTTRKTLSAILNSKQSVSSEMALRLSAAFPTASPELWLRLQAQYDLAQARRTFNVSSIKPINFQPPQPKAAA